MKKLLKRRVLFFFFLALIILPTATRLFADEKSKASPIEETPGAIHVVKAQGTVNPVMGEYIVESLEEAKSTGASMVIIELDTPGGLDLSMRDIVKALLNSPVPVAVYVSPPGSRAASAGVFITMAAHIAAMAPGTNIGSAHPVAMGGEKMDETMIKKVENDAAAYIKSIAKKKNRNVEWAEKAVRESVNITASEAVKLKVIDLVAEDTDALIVALEGWKVLVDGKEVTLRTKGAKIAKVEMGLRHRILDAITNPNVAYILMMIGMVGIYFELSNPGAIFPGVIGAICLILAFYSFQTLPVNYAGLLLIGLAIAFFIAELSVVSFGLLTIAGIVSLTLGSLMLFDSPLPFMRVSVSVILPTIILVSIFISVTLYYAVRIFKRTPVSGAEGLVGTEGTASSNVDPEGKVYVSGEYWNAESADHIKKGDKVAVISIDGLKLSVRKV
jgi:membrane-bound serine protease (ClpP class)